LVCRTPALSGLRANTDVDSPGSRTVTPIVPYARERYFENHKMMSAVDMLHKLYTRPTPDPEFLFRQDKKDYKLPPTEELTPILTRRRRPGRAEQKESKLTSVSQ
jgi:hypothetical protein